MNPAPPVTRIRIVECSSFRSDLRTRGSAIPGVRLILAPSSERSPPRDAQAFAATVVYLLWVASGFWKVAPMSISAALAGLATLLALRGPGGPRWPGSPADTGGAAWGLALLVSALFAVD